MAVPVIAGIFGGFFQFATLWFSYKTALRIAAVGALFSSWLLFTGAAIAILTSIVQVTPPLLQKSFMFLPSNLGAVIGALFAVKLAQNAYNLQKRVLKIGLYTY